MEVDTDVSPSLDLFGKVIGDLQDDVEVTEEKITGTLAKIADYTAAGFDMSKGDHFLVLHSTSEEEGVTIKVKATPSASGTGEVTLDSDGISITQITDDVETITITATKGSLVSTKVLALDLELEEE